MKVVFPGWGRTNAVGMLMASMLIGAVAEQAVVSCSTVKALYKQHDCCSTPDGVIATIEAEPVPLPNPADPDGISAWYPQLLGAGRGDHLPTSMQGRYMRGAECDKYMDVKNNRVIDQGTDKSGILYYDSSTNELFIKHVFNHIHNVSMLYDRQPESIALTGHVGPTAACAMRIQRFSFNTSQAQPFYKYDKVYTNCVPYNATWTDVARRAAVIFKTWNTSYPAYASSISPPSYDAFLAAYPIHMQSQGPDPANRALFYQLTRMPWQENYVRCGPAGHTCAACAALDQPALGSFTMM